MTWLGWIIVYAIVGIVVAEICFSGARRERRPYSVAAYVCALALWPVVVLAASVAVFRGE